LTFDTGVEYPDAGSFSCAIPANGILPKPSIKRRDA
jgi:hypothetical protein